ncbi:uncharacterized protein LOC119593645 [Penaeus monodon]|uniref:uncharacterized protein LOC119593645 n=1 Tax=Penaeus monodon TaxID=6687 RepID=UPI0018A74AC9|nr:uncharacterized protein LOC119593645 [Penaeus monodon]
MNISVQIQVLITVPSFVITPSLAIDVKFGISDSVTFMYLVIKYGLSDGSPSCTPAFAMDPTLKQHHLESTSANLGRAQTANNAAKNPPCFANASPPLIKLHTRYFATMFTEVSACGMQLGRDCTAVVASTACRISREVYSERPGLPSTVTVGLGSEGHTARTFLTHDDKKSKNPASTNVRSAATKNRASVRISPLLILKSTTTFPHVGWLLPVRSGSAAPTPPSIYKGTGCGCFQFCFCEFVRSSVLRMKLVSVLLAALATVLGLLHCARALPHPFPHADPEPRRSSKPLFDPKFSYGYRSKPYYGDYVRTYRW